MQGRSYGEIVRIAKWSFSSTYICSTMIVAPSSRLSLLDTLRDVSTKWFINVNESWTIEMLLAPQLLISLSEYLGINLVEVGDVYELPFDI